MAGDVLSQPHSSIQISEDLYRFPEILRLGDMHKRSDSGLPDAEYPLQVNWGPLVWYDCSWQQSYTQGPDAGFWKRFGVGFSGILPIESLLLPAVIQAGLSCCENFFLVTPLIILTHPQY